MKILQVIQKRITERFRGNKGFSTIAIIIALVVLASVILPVSQWMISVNKQANLTSARVEMMNTAIEGFKFIQESGYLVAKKKANNTETQTVGDNEMTIVYKTPLADGSIPIEITVKNTREPDAKPYVFDNQIYAVESNFSTVYARVNSLDSRLTEIQKKISNLPK